jgi:asparagine synthase (glutamine-hydrolysing)
MCGILVYFGKERLTVDHPSLTSIAHRGPDGSGMKSYRINDFFLSLGHRRLSIIDLSDKAAQPMSYHDRLWITYNGEIYNYIELKEELRQDGYMFHTNSDTEVLLASYHKWGESCLEKLNGMFAFAIWDDQSKILFVARDRYGIKPLYYWNSPDGFAVVSEIKQVTNLPGFEASLNYEAGYQFLKYGDFCFDKHTLWRNVFELEPGMMFQVDLNKREPCDTITPRKWYDLTPYLNCVPVDESDAIERFRYLLEDSIRLRLRSDVPVGFALSGGLDSSSIICLATKKIKPGFPFQTFSACCEEPSVDERPFIHAVLNDIDVEANILFMDPSYIIDNMDFVTTKHDLPITRTSIFSHHQLCQTSHLIGTKVILEGEGPDEVLAGYTSFFWAFLSELLLTFRGITAIREYLHFRRMNESSLGFAAKQMLSTMSPYLIRMYQNQKLRFQQKKSYLNFNGWKDSCVNIEPEIVREQRSIYKMQIIRMKFLRAILHNVDRVSMAHSVEVRNPFLDYRLIEFCLALPASLKIQNGRQKHLLRQAMVDILPSKIKERTDKMGFSSPEGQWAKGPLKEFYRESLLKLEALPFVNSKVVQSNYEDFIKGLIPYDRIFWRLISFQHWLKIFKISI